MIGGIGSNQYQTKPGSSIDRSRTGRADLAAAATDVEEVGWAFHPDSASWKAVGFHTLAEASPWITGGFGPHDARAAADCGFAAADFAPWAKHDFPPAVVHMWRSNLFTADEAARWRTAFRGITFTVESIAELAKWRTTGLEPQKARWWNTCGWESPTDAAPWIAGPDPALGYTRLGGRGFTDPREAATWRDAGFDASTAFDWFESGYQPTRAARAVSNGQRPPSRDERR